MDKDTIERKIQKYEQQINQYKQKLFGGNMYVYKLINYKNTEEFFDCIMDTKNQRDTALLYKKLFHKDRDALINMIYGKCILISEFDNIKHILVGSEEEKKNIIYMSIRHVINDFFTETNYIEKILCNNINNDLRLCMHELNQKIKEKNNCVKNCKKFDIYEGVFGTMYQNIVDQTIDRKIDKFNEYMFYIKNLLNNNRGDDDMYLTRLNNFFIGYVKKPFDTQILMSVTVRINCVKNEPNYQEHMYINKNIDLLLCDMIIKHIVKTNNIKTFPFDKENMSIKLHAFCAKALQAEKIVFSPLNSMIYLLEKNDAKIELTYNNGDVSQNASDVHSHIIYVDDKLKNFYPGTPRVQLVVENNLKKVLRIIY